MSTMIREVYDALKEAGASEEKAAAAAEALADYKELKTALPHLATQSDLKALEATFVQEMAAFRAEARQEMAALRADMRQEVANLQNGLAGLQSGLGQRLSAVETKLGLFQWLIGGVGFGVLILVIRAFLM